MNLDALFLSYIFAMLMSWSVVITSLVKGEYNSEYIRLLFDIVMSLIPGINLLTLVSYWYLCHKEYMQENS